MIADSGSLEMLKWAFVAVLFAGSFVGPSRTFGQEPNDDAALRFVVKYDHEFAKGPLDGRLLVLLSKDLVGEPRTRLMNPDSEGWVFAVPVTAWRPGTPIVVDDRAMGYPGKMSDLPKGKYSVQAILSVNEDEHDFTIAPGNGRSQTLRIDLDPGTSGSLDLDIKKEIARRPPADLPRVFYRRIESRYVGRHVGHRRWIDVAVIYPHSFSRDDKLTGKRFPVQYWIPGFEQNTRSAIQFFQSRGLYHSRLDPAPNVENFIHVLVTTDTKSGHHFWVDSENNGPFGLAFRDEIVPQIESEFPIISEPSSRFLVGIGAGGWSALWLAMQNPDMFGGAWAMSPDPLTFTDFYGADLYATPSPDMYTESDGSPRRIISGVTTPLNEFREVARLEDVLGVGGKVGSYEAAFGPRDARGKVRPLFDRTTGIVDREVVAEWSRFDFLRQLEANWATLGSKLNGKLHVFVGKNDGFRRAAAVEKLADWVVKSGAGLEVRIIPNYDHEMLDDPNLHQTLQAEISKARAWALGMRKK